MDLPPPPSPPISTKRSLPITSVPFLQTKAEVPVEVAADLTGADSVEAREMPTLTFFVCQRMCSESVQNGWTWMKTECVKAAH